MRTFQLLLYLDEGSITTNSLGDRRLTKEIRSAATKLRYLGDEVDADMLDRIAESLESSRVGVLKNVRFRCTDDPSILIRTGDEPVITCQSALKNSMESLERLVEKLDDGFVKMWEVTVEDIDYVSRADARAGLSQSGKKGIYLEDDYSLHEGVIGPYLKEATRLYAQELGFEAGSSVKNAEQWTLMGEGEFYSDAANGVMNSTARVRVVRVG